jgi:hypothetical protein
MTGESLGRKDLERRRESAARNRYITAGWGLARDEVAVHTIARRGKTP